MDEAVRAPPSRRLSFGSIAVILFNIAGLGFSGWLCLESWEACPARSGIPIGFGDGIDFVLVQAVGSIIPCLLVNLGYLTFAVIQFRKSREWQPFAALGCFVLAWVALIMTNNAYSCVYFPVW